MARPEKTLDVDAGPLPRFAQDLRDLRQAAGGMTYRTMAARVNYSPTVLSEAAAGRKLPTLAVTLAYVEACDGDRDEWTARWHEVAGTPPAAPTRRRGLMWTALAAAVGVAVAVAVVVLVLWQGEPVRPEEVPAEDYPVTAGQPADGQPPAGAPCSTHAQARACVDKPRGVVWVKDLPPADGHHAALYWTTTNGSALGDCHNYLKADGPWVTCPYSGIDDGAVIGFRAAVVEQEKIVDWGPYVELQHSAD